MLIIRVPMYLLCKTVNTKEGKKPHSHSKLRKQFLLNHINLKDINQYLTLAVAVSHCYYNDHNDFNVPGSSEQQKALLRIDTPNIMSIL